MLHCVSFEYFSIMVSILVFVLVVSLCSTVGAVLKTKYWNLQYRILVHCNILNHYNSIHTVPWEHSSAGFEFTRQTILRYWNVNFIKTIITLMKRKLIYNSLLLYVVGWGILVQTIPEVLGFTLSTTSPVEVRLTINHLGALATRPIFPYQPFHSLDQLYYVVTWVSIQVMWGIMLEPFPHSS